MYWTAEGSIFRAGMDGSDRKILTTIPLSGRRALRGITIDFQTSRLLWACADGDKVQSSNMDGGDIQTIITVPSNSWPFGIGMFADRIYWTNYNLKTLSSCTRTGEDYRILYTGTISSPFHLAMVPALDPPKTRGNPCERQNCTGVCVLTPTASRCLP